MTFKSLPLTVFLHWSSWLSVWLCHPVIFQWPSGPAGVRPPGLRQRCYVKMQGRKNRYGWSEMNSGTKQNKTKQTEMSRISFKGRIESVWVGLKAQLGSFCLKRRRISVNSWSRKTDHWAAVAGCFRLKQKWYWNNSNSGSREQLVLIVSEVEQLAVTTGPHSKTQREWGWGGGIGVYGQGLRLRPNLPLAVWWFNTEKPSAKHNIHLQWRIINRSAKTIQTQHNMFTSYK